MGKAAKRRKAYQKDKLVALSYHNPQIFAEQWDMRIESWLIEVRKLAAEWRYGRSTKKLAFEILDNALELLKCCEPKVAACVQERTYNELSNACSLAVAESIDSRLYRLSNYDSLRNNSKKGRGPYCQEVNV